MVIAIESIAHSSRKLEVLTEAFRVLRPGGVVIINVPAYMWMWSYHDDSCQTKHRYTRPEIDGDIGCSRAHRHQRQEEDRAPT